jgi:hypothetical protein
VKTSYPSKAPVQATSHSVIDDFGLGNNSQTDIFTEEQPVRKVSNIGATGGAGV